MKLDEFLIDMIEQDSSDLFLSVGAPPSIKVNGELSHLNYPALSAKDTAQIAMKIMSDEQIETFSHELEMNLAIVNERAGRFRVNIFRQKNEISLVFRSIKTEIPKLDALGLPPSLTDLIMEKRGLVLFVGATGSGKSTSLAALINHRNQNSHGHIITIEDPVEFIHQHKECIVHQREIGFDTLSYKNALENTLRQAPDVIMIGEIRNRSTMEYALTFAETGHLCVSTLHANNANQAIERILSFFPEDMYKEVLLGLSLNLRGIVSQRLIPDVKNERSVAVEVLLTTPFIQELIKNNQITKVKEAMEKAEHLGLQTFDTALYNLYKAGLITEQVAYENADAGNNLRLRIQLEESNDKDSSTSFNLKSDDS